MAKNPYEDWQTFPLADQQGILGEEDLANAAIESAPSPTVGDLMAAQQSSYLASAGSSGRPAPAAIDLGKLPESPVVKSEPIPSSPTEQAKPEPLTSSVPTDQLLNPNKTALPGRIQAVGDKDPSAFIVHHTSGRGSVEGVVSTLKERHLGVQYVMDRDGNIFATGGPGAANIKTGWGPHGKGLSNQNIVGMEIIANDDKDVTDAQKQSFAKFIQARYPTTPLWGHGEVNPGHKEADEGLSAKAAALALRGGTTAPTALAATTSAPAVTVASSARSTLGTVRAMSEWVPGEPRTTTNQYGALMEGGKPVKLGMTDIAMSPNLLKQHGLKLGDKIDVLDSKTGQVLYPNQRIADTSWYSKGKPTADTIELWGRPDIGHAQIRKAGEAGGPAVATGGTVGPATSDFIEPALVKAIASAGPTTSENLAKTKPPAVEAIVPNPPPIETKPPVLAIAGVPSESIKTPQQLIAAARARLRLPRLL